MPEHGIFIKTLSHFWCRYLMLLFCIIQETAALAAVEQTQATQRDPHTRSCEEVANPSDSSLSLSVCIVGPTGNTNRRVPKYTNKCVANEPKFSQGSHGSRKSETGDEIRMGRDGIPSTRAVEPPFELWHSELRGKMSSDNEERATQIY